MEFITKRSELYYRYSLTEEVKIQSFSAKVCNGVGRKKVFGDRDQTMSDIEKESDEKWREMISSLPTVSQYLVVVHSQVCQFTALMVPEIFLYHHNKFTLFAKFSSIGVLL